MSLSRIKVLLINCSLFFCASHGFSLDFNIRVKPELCIPFGPAATPYYSLGGGATLNTDLELFQFVYVGPEFGYFNIPLLDTGTATQFIDAGIGAGIFYYPASRVKVQGGLVGGVYEVMYDGTTFKNTWWKIRTDAGFRFSPTFVLSGGVGYTRYNGVQEPMYTGFNLGASAQIAFNTSIKATGNVEVKLDQGEPVFPLFYGIYKQNSIGKLKITNNESAEIRNVSVSFRAGNYTSSLMSCGRAGLLKKRASIDLPLYADFAETILNFTENGKIPGELIIDYEILGATRSVSKTLVVPVYNRNAVRWTDTAVLASYISPNAPEVLDYSKFMVGIARDNLRTGLNRNMQFAMYLFEGLKVGGLSNSNDDTTPYKKYHRNPELVDYIQYPFQTLAYHSGDYDDLGILYAASLESVGIRAAVIPLKDDFVVAFSLGITAADAENLFSDSGNLLTIADEIWIPVSFSVLREGFINSWYNAINKINAAFTADEDVDFIILQQAWATYPPASIKGTEAKFQKPAEESVIRTVESDLMRYISAEFGPKILDAQDNIRTSGGTAQLYNQLGILYVRAGMYTEAKAEYKKAAALNSASAMVNLGNIAILQKDFRTAKSWYSQALEIQPENNNATKGLERALTELEE